MNTPVRAAASPRHVPVMLRESLGLMGVVPGGLYCDCTLGSGGHAEAILEAAAPGGRLLGIDCDPRALARARERLAGAGCLERAKLEMARFDNLAAAADRAGFGDFDAILFDLGYSSDQLEDPERGLSFQLEAPLDMRIDPTSPTTAADLVNTLSEPELADLIYHLGEERASRRIARAIVGSRPIDTTSRLAEVVARARGGGPRSRRRDRLHPATRTFQALRIAVNDELETLERGLEAAVVRLVPGGRLVVISFHSLEDRIVKRFFKAAAGLAPSDDEPAPDGPPRVALLTRKPLRPSPEEVSSNPRSRSAKLRGVQRLGGEDVASVREAVAA